VCRIDHPDTSADVRGPNGEHVADCGCHDQAAANAALIAAAPDLLAAVRRALEDGGMLMGATRRGEMRRALAKAEAVTVFSGADAGTAALGAARPPSPTHPPGRDRG